VEAADDQDDKVVAQRIEGAVNIFSI